ncbi:MAG: hypothetical protein V1672_05880 [Candidatus Diapherotrites archaeon]
MEEISFNEFKKMDLRVAKISNVEDLEGKDKLYKITIDTGEEKTIVAGIKLFYTKEELQGKNIIVVNNMKPALISGVKSNAMLLAVQGEDGKYVLVTTDKEVQAGSKVE